MEAQEQRKKDPRKKKKKTVILCCSISAFAIIGGVACGVTLHNLLNNAPKTVLDMDDDKYNFDATSAMAAYDKLSPKTDYVESFSEVELANISLQLLKRHSSFIAQGIGKAVSMGVTQEVRSTSVRQGSEYFEESLSHSSIVDCAWRMYQTGETIEQYKGSIYNGDVEKALFATEATAYTLDSYRDRMGRTLDTGSSYLISNKTLWKSSDATAAPPSGVPTSKKKNEDGTYTVELELSRTRSITRYVRQMKNISDLQDYPSFDYVHLSFELGTDLTLNEVRTNESYFAQPKGLAVAPNVKGNLRTLYDYSGSAVIPELNSFIKYRENM